MQKTTLSTSVEHPLTQIHNPRTMSGSLVLFTGATGHVGYATLVEALSKGYNIRAAVRSESKAALIKSAKSTQPYLSQLSFVIVPDIEQDGAFDEAVKGVDYIMHVASPLAKPSEDPENDIIRPAIRGTLSVLNSALKEPKIKRVVITASVASISPENKQNPFTADNVEEDPSGPYPSSFVAYSASKKLAYNRTRDFIAQQAPHFTIINIMPVFVIGKNELATSTKDIDAGSNALALSTLLGRDVPSFMPGSVCHVDDVAFVHVAALDPKIKGNQNFGVNLNVRGTHHWDAAINIIKKHFPNAFEEGIFPFGGRGECQAYAYDTTATEETFNFKHKTYEAMVVSLAGHYIDIARKENPTKP